MSHAWLGIFVCTYLYTQLQVPHPPLLHSPTPHHTGRTVVPTAHPDKQKGLKERYTVSVIKDTLPTLRRHEVKDLTVAQ